MAPVWDPGRDWFRPGPIQAGRTSCTRTGHRWMLSGCVQRLTEDNPREQRRVAALARDSLMPPTGSSRIAAALASSSVVHAAGRPSPLAVKLIAGHGARASGSSGREAAGIRGLRDGWASGRVPGDLGRSGGRTPARTIQRTGAPKRRGGAGRCDPWSPQRRRVRLPGASVPFPAVTLSDTRVRENAHTPAVLSSASAYLKDVG